MTGGPDRTAPRVAPAWSLGVLAGGAGSRMGRDKGSAPFAGSTLLEHAVRRYAPAGVPVLVSTRKDGPAPPAGAERVDDEEPGCGPLAGLVALLGRTRTKFLLAVPCDAPLLPPDVGDRLLSFARGADAVLVEREGRVEPFPALIAAEIRPLLRRLFAEGARRADAWHERAVAAYVPCGAAFPGVDADRAFWNANDPAGLAEAERLLRAGG
jgi:molybdopterin-guanine dinucleotide biosynthesis protein A